MDKKKTDTLVIIPNFNQLDILKQCIENLETLSEDNFDVIIVDNGSNDETINFIKNINNKKHTYHKMFLSENFGFSIAVNKGLEYSISNDYTYSILLNNDAFVCKDFVINLTKEIKTDKNLFAVSSLMLSYQDNNIIDDFGDQYNLLAFAFQNKTGQNVNIIKKDEYVFSACGGAAIYDNEKLKEVGYFDDKFFAYLEDVDISYRARLLGYKVKTCKSAKVIHIGSATSGAKYSSFKVKLSARNSIYLIYKNMPFLQILFNIVFIVLGLLIKQLYFIKKGFGKDYFYGIMSSFKNLHQLDRSKIKKSKLHTFLYIEFYLFINTFKYVFDYIKRRIKC